MKRITRILAVLCIVFATSFFGFAEEAGATNTNGINAQVYNCAGWNNAPPRPCNQNAPVNTTTVSTIDFNWGGGPVLSNRYEDVEVKFTGYIMSPTTKTVTFYAPGDDGIHFTFNNTLLINDWYDKGGGGSISQSVTLQANTPYPFTLWFYENGGGANVWLYWNDGSGDQIVPASVFYLTEPTPPLPPSLNPPTNLSLTTQTENITLSWTAPTPTQANTAVERYAVSWSTSNFTTNGWGIATGNVGDATALNTSITIPYSVITTDGTGKEYQFKIRADNDSLSTYSQDSNIVTLYIPSPLPFTPQHTINENESIVINAPEGKLIDQISGWYGHPNDGSQGINVSNQLTQQFTNLATANISATNANFTDPVPGVGKILILSFTYKNAPEPEPTPTPTPTPTQEPTPTPTPTLEPTPEPSPEPQQPPVQPPAPPVEPSQPYVPPPTPEPPPVRPPDPVVPPVIPVDEPDPQPEPEPEPEPEVPVEPEQPVDEIPTDTPGLPDGTELDPVVVPEDPSPIEDQPLEQEDPVQDNTETEVPQETIDTVPEIQDDSNDTSKDIISITEDLDLSEKETKQLLEVTEDADLSEEQIKQIAEVIADSGLSKDQVQGLVDVIENADLSKEEIKQLAELIQSDPVIAQAVEQFNERAQENANAPMPYTLADAATEVQAEAIVAGLTEAFTDPAAAFAGAAESLAELANFAGDLLSSPGEALASLGSDMTDDQREKAQEVIIPVIIVSQVVNAVAQILSARRM